jgi:NADPH-dependent 2,4-dienoyl-CoA reductase/sulfur reductase-like enzyme
MGQSSHAPMWCARGREPNRLATTLVLHEGLVAESQNRWPSLRVDVMALSGLFGRFLPAGFYYKTFMAPGWAWERLYEPLTCRYLPEVKLIKETRLGRTLGTENAARQESRGGKITSGRNRRYRFHD